MFGTLIFSSCSKDDDATNDNSGEVINPDKKLPDPTGTVTLNIMVGDDKNNKVTINNFGIISINSAYNFVGENSCSFVSLGKMKGLGNITTIPQDGWNSSIAVNPGDGYVARVRSYDGYYDYTSYDYARLYVINEIEGTSGGVIGYTIKCQAPFVFAPKFKESSIEFGATEDLTKELTFVTLTKATVKSCPEWCKVRLTEKGFKLTAIPNYTETEYNGTIEFENSEGSTSITVKQKKSDNPKFAAGRGTESEPWVIATAAQLDEVRNFPEANFELGKDIDLSSYLNPNTTGWKPIENFAGTFDGKKHTINGLWINLSSIDNVGLFARTKGNTKISNLFVKIDNKGITGKNSVGGICGILEGCIENCMVTGDINGICYVGGICGDSPNYYKHIANISQCASSGKITADSNVGGILGGYDTIGNSSIWNCYSMATIKAKSSTSYGIGYRSTNCYFAGTITIESKYDSWFYPIANYLTYSYYDSEKMNIPENIDGLTAEKMKEGALTTEQMKKQASFQGWDFDKIWTIKEGVDYPKLRSLQK